jgi:RNA polymerase sigma factor (sigma-70 family)
MAQAPGSETSTTLLGRLALFPLDQAAWEQFVERYGPLVVGWCRRWGAQEADALDVTQVVLSKLAIHLRSFAYDTSRSFRTWLRTVALNAWRDSIAARPRDAARGETEILTFLHEVEARDDLLRRLDEQFDLELLEEASRRVRVRVQAKTWSAYELTAIDGLSGKSAAARLGTTVGSVFVAKSNVMQMLREEIQRLEYAVVPSDCGVPPDGASAPMDCPG